MGWLRDKLDEFTHPAGPYSWAQVLSDRADAAPYEIIQAGPGASVEARPAEALVPNGKVWWSLHNQPGTVGAATGILSQDKVFNISGAPWT
jgi:hypothetical protein